MQQRTISVLTIILGLLGACVGYLAGWAWTGGHPAWGFVGGLVGLLGVSIPLNLWVRKRLEAALLDVQKMLSDGQDALKRKAVLLQNKMRGGGKGVQKALEKEQTAMIRQALAELDKVRSLYKWSVLAERQTNTLRAQLHYQLREFEEADRFFQKCLVLDPITLAMKMVRMYRKGDWKALEKAFRRGKRRFKDEKATLLYAVYSWILVKENRIDDAIKVLDEGRQQTENEVLQKNWEHLVNGRARRFSNAGLGEQWYALFLESPKPTKVRQRRVRAR